MFKLASNNMPAPAGRVLANSVAAARNAGVREVAFAPVLAAKNPAPVHQVLIRFALRSKLKFHFHGVNLAEGAERVNT